MHGAVVARRRLQEHLEVARADDAHQDGREGAGGPLAGVRIAINDMGATPAVVSLRLDQAVAELPAAAQGARP